MYEIHPRYFVFIKNDGWSSELQWIFAGVFLINLKCFHFYICETCKKDRKRYREKNGSKFSQYLHSSPIENTSKIAMSDQHYRFKTRADAAAIETHTFLSRNTTTNKRTHTQYSYWCVFAPSREIIHNHTYIEMHIRHINVTHTKTLRITCVCVSSI